MPPELDPLFARFQEALAGRYSLERELGRGGMGIVYLAHEVRLERPVAIKLLPPDLAAHLALRERFLREARTAARLSHPNIVPLHAVDEAAGYVYYAMAYVPGETLARRVARGTLPPLEAARVLRELAWALAYAHAQGVVHRDIKPENVILEQGSGRAMVTDFGIAAVEWDTRDTAPGQLLGTPEFMSPEQASGEAVDGRSDLYSVGALGYFLLSGQPPYQGASTARLLAQHLTAPVPSLAAAAPGVPEALAQILERCLAKEPGQRPDSGAQLADELGVLLQANPEPPAPMRALLRQFKLMVLGAVLPGLAIVISTVAGGLTGILEVAAISVAGLAVTAAYSLYLCDGQVKQLREMGYEPRDVAHAADAQARSRHEEASTLLRAEPLTSTPQRARRWLWILLGIFLLTAAAIRFYGASLADYIILVSAAAGVISQIRALEAYRNPATVTRSLTGRFWRSRFVAWRWKRLTGQDSQPSDALNRRPTATRLGLTVDELFAALPMEMKRELHGVLPLVRRLEARTQAARIRMAELDRLIAEARRAGTGDGAGDDRARLLEKLGASKAAEGTRLEVLVAALETIRLDLLRLRAGTGTVERITADLAAAAEIAAQTDRLLAGREEADRLARQVSRSP